MRAKTPFPFHRPTNGRGGDGGGSGGRVLLSREFLRYLSPGLIITVGFIDPGNWATNIAGASIVVAAGILEAVVMPHNIYLHSNVILSRDWSGRSEDRRRLMSYEFGDTALAMDLGWLINSAMVVVAATVFSRLEPT